MDAFYEERQVVGIDLHRRRPVLVRITETGQRLEATRIVNDSDRLAEVMARAGEAAEVAEVAAGGHVRGWPRRRTPSPAGCERTSGASAGVKAFSYRRANNDERDAADLADLLRKGRLPEAWIGPPASRKLRELVRHRAKLVGLRTSVKCQVHAVLAVAGILVSMSDLYGVEGNELLKIVNLPSASRARIDSARRMISALDWEAELFTNLVTGLVARRPGPTGDPGHSRVRPSWRRCSSPRSPTSPAAGTQRSWRRGPGSRPATTSPTPPCTARGSQENWSQEPEVSLPDVWILLGEAVARGQVEAAAVGQGSVWELLESLIPPPAPPKGPDGRPRIDDRAALEGIVFVLDTGCRWRDLPPQLGCG